jgi:hypothetical protein
VLEDPNLRPNEQARHEACVAGPITVAVLAGALSSFTLAPAEAAPPACQGKGPLRAEPKIIQSTQWLGEDATAAVSLDIRGKEASQLRVITRTLRLRGGGEGSPDSTIPRHRVAASVEDGNPPRRVTITVTGVPNVGTFEGQLEIRASRKRCSIPVTLTFLDRPALVLAASSEEGLTMQLLDCAPRICPTYDKFMAPGLHLTEKGDVILPGPLRNESRNDATFSVGGLVWREPSGGKIASVVAEEEDAATIRARSGRLVEVTLRVDVDQLAPGKYSAALLFDAPGGEEQLAVPLTINVKSGPILAIVAILLGLLGFLIGRWARSRTAHRTLLKRARILANSLPFRLREPTDLDLIKGQLTNVEHLVFLDRAALATTELASVESRIDSLDQARRKQALLQGTDKEAEANLIVQQIVKAIEARVDADVKARLDELKALHAAPPATSEHAAWELRHGQQAGYEAKAVRQTMWRESKWNRFAIQYLPKILYGLLAIALVFLGLQALYASNVTFGSDPLFDYGGLVLWGIGADVVSDKLRGLLPQASEIPQDSER